MPRRAAASRHRSRRWRRPARAASSLPGNHDWKGPDGWSAVLRAEAIVAEEGDGRVVQLPGNGCPGPGGDGHRPRARGDDRHRVVAAQDRAEAGGAGQRMRRPPASSSIHSARSSPAADGRSDARRRSPSARGRGRARGYFGWKDYFFPLRHVQSWLWLPLAGHRCRVPCGAQCGNLPAGHVEQDLSPPDRLARIGVPRCAPRGLRLQVMNTACR